MTRIPSVKTLCARLRCDSTIAGAVRYVLSRDPRTDLGINDTLKTVSVLVHGYGVEYVPSKMDTHGRGPRTRIREHGRQLQADDSLRLPTQAVYLRIVGRHCRV